MSTRITGLKANAISDAVLEELKQGKATEMKSKRDELEMSGFIYLGKTFDSDQKAIQRISIAVLAAQAVLMAGQEVSFDWTLADNSIISLTAQEFIGLPIAMAQYANVLHEHYRLLKIKIEECSSAAEVEAISWGSI